MDDEIKASLSERTAMTMERLPARPTNFDPTITSLFRPRIGLFSFAAHAQRLAPSQSMAASPSPRKRFAATATLLPAVTLSVPNHQRQKLGKIAVLGPNRAP